MNETKKLYSGVDKQCQNFVTGKKTKKINKSLLSLMREHTKGTYIENIYKRRYQ